MMPVGSDMGNAIEQIVRRKMALEDLNRMAGTMIVCLCLMSDKDQITITKTLMKKAERYAVDWKELKTGAVKLRIREKESPDGQE